jgi:hypothetical protein
MVVLFNNGHGEAGANAAFAFGADCEKVDGVLHGFAQKVLIKARKKWPAMAAAARRAWS